MNRCSSLFSLPAGLPRQTRPTLLAAAASAALVSLACAGMLLAASLPASAHAQGAQGNAAELRAFNVPAGTLEQALNEFGRQAGVLLSFTSDAVAGQQSAGLQGQYTVAQGFAALLGPNGLQATRQGNGSYALSKLVLLSTARASDPGTLPEVVVTAPANATGITEGTGSYTTGSTSAATGLNLSLRETPQSVTVLTRQRLDDQNLNSLGQVLAQTPGLSVVASSSQAPLTNSSAYSRGYLLNRFQIDGATASPYSFTAGGAGYLGLGGLDTAIYDSITVVRGATGLLGGAGDPSGSVNLTRKRPTDSFQASLTGSAGRWDQYRAVADVGGPLNAASTVRGRVVALYDDSENWVDRYQHDKKAAYGVLDVDLGEATLLSLALEHHRGNYKGASNVMGFPVAFTDGTPTPYSRSDNPSTNWSRMTQEKTVASLALEHHINDDWRAKVRYGYTDDETGLSYGAVQGVAADGSITSFIASTYVSPVVTRSHDWDARLDGRYTLFGRKHDLIAGFNGYSSRYENHGRSLFRRPVAGNALGWDGSSYPEPDWTSLAESRSDAETQQYGLFLATRLRPTDDLSVILGGRLSNWKTKTVNRLTGATTDDRKESAQFTPYAGVVYDLSDSLSAYASYTEIFNPQSYKDASGSILDPEEGKNYELGLKGEWFGGRLNASAAVFETRKDNLAVRDGDNLTPDGGLAYVAASGTKGRGWELEVAGELARGWQLQGGYARIVTNDADGNRLNTAYVPKHSFKLFSTWTPARLSGLTVGGGLQWQSEVHTTNANAALQRLYTQKNYAVASLLAQYRFDEHWHLSVNLNNVFDKSYRTSTTLHEYGAGRNLQATLRYQF